MKISGLDTWYLVCFNDREHNGTAVFTKADIITVYGSNWTTPECRFNPTTDDLEPTTAEFISVKFSTRDLRVEHMNQKECVCIINKERLIWCAVAHQSAAGLLFIRAGMTLYEFINVIEQAGGTVTGDINTIVKATLS